MTQWFDVYSWNSAEHADWEVEGLRETTAWVHELLRRECEVVGAANVVLGGLSQGCASSLIAMLLWEGEPLKAVVGMSGWLPLRHIMMPHLKGETTSPEKRADENQQLQKRDAEVDGFQEATKALCRELGINEVVGQVAKKIPVVLVHGALDETVEMHLGESARDCLKSLGLNVTWQQYDDLEHWMCGEELADMVEFAT